MVAWLNNLNREARVIMKESVYACAKKFNFDFLDLSRCIFKITALIVNIWNWRVSQAIYMQHSRPCCIRYTCTIQLSLRLEFVYSIQHCCSCCKYYILCEKYPMQNVIFDIRAFHLFTARVVRLSWGFYCIQYSMPYCTVLQFIDISSPKCPKYSTY